MAHQLLPGTKLNNDRYQVIKTVRWKTYGGTYEAWDIEITDKRYIIKEVIAPRMTEEEMNKRREFFLENLAMLVHLEHPNLAAITDYFEESNRFYMVVEYIEGITIENFLGVIEKLPEKQVLNIGLKLCDAVSLLWNRPKPISFENLDLGHIMVDYEKNLKFLGYDLSHFFYGDFPPRTFANSPEVMETSIHKLSKILFFLMGGGKEIPEERIPANVRISEEFRKLLYVVLNPGQKSYSSIKAFRDELEKILDPQKSAMKAQQEHKRWRRFIKDIPSFDWLNKIPGRIYRTFNRQRTWIKILEIVTVIFIISFSFFMKKTEQKKYHRPEGIPIVYITGESEVVTIRGDDFQVIDRKALGGKLNSACLVKGKKGDFLAIADSAGNRVYFLNILDNSLAMSVPTDKDPGKISFDEKSNSVFIFHEAQSCITIINSDTFHIINILPSGRGSIDMVYSAVRKLLFVSDWLPQDIIQLDPLTRAIKQTDKILGKPGMLTISPDGKTLCVHDIKTNKILIYDVSSRFTSTGSLESEEMGVPSSFLWDIRPGRLWVTYEKENRIILFNIEENKIVENHVIEKGPRKAAWIGNNKLLIINAGSREMVVIEPYSGRMESNIPLDKTPSDVVVSPAL